MTTVADRRWFALSSERLRDLCSYDPDTGVFSRRVMRNYRWRQGDAMGSLSDEGYVCIKIDGRTYKAHRLAFFYMHAEWPTRQIDHINGNRADNRWVNLRQATQHQNARNAKKPITNSSGVKGVCFHRPTGKWTVRAWDGQGRNRYGGIFSCLADAEKAARALRETLHGEFANHGGGA